MKKLRFICPHCEQQDQVYAILKSESAYGKVDVYRMDDEKIVAEYGPWIMEGDSSESFECCNCMQVVATSLKDLGDLALKQNGFDAQYDYPIAPWDNHPDYPAKAWKKKVQNGDTRLGYVDWVRLCKGSTGSEEV